MDDPPQNTGSDGAPVDPSAALRRRALFEHWGDDEWAQWVNAARKKEIDAGVLIRPPQEELIAVLVEGRASGSLSTPYGPLPLHTIGATSLLYPLLYFVSGSELPDYRTVEPARLWVYPVGELRELCSAPRFQHAWYWTCWKSLSVTVRDRSRMLGKFFEAAEGVMPPPTSDPRPVKVSVADKRRLFEAKGLSGFVIQFLSTLSREHRFEPGSSVFAEGEPGDAMYVVVEGEVTISRRIPGVGREAITTVRRGEFFGAMALIDDEPRTNDATVHGEAVTVLAIPREILGEIVSVDRVVSLRMLEILCGLMARRLHEIEEKLVGWFVLAGGVLGPLTER